MTSTPHTSRPKHDWRPRQACRAAFVGAVVVGAWLSAVAAGATTATFTAGANTRIRFVGSNVQCLVYERSDSETVPAGIDCFYDNGSVGQMGAYHANLDALNQVSVGRTFVTGIKIPGGATKRVWSLPETQGGGEQSVHSPSNSITLRLGETVRIGSTRIACLYQSSDIIDVGATAVACVNDAGSPAGAAGNTDDFFGFTPTTIPDAPRYAIFVSDRVAAVLSIKNGRTTLMVQARHFK